MKPTTEQQNISQLVKEGHNVKVIAGAGAGKSSTLRYVAKQVPARNVLVLIFNKANAVETLEHPDRPTNLFACTSHSY
jgi:ABC-type transporter Mla maintaining outer membrane lipid asymmetry ATPase subunit MlaF